MDLADKFAVNYYEWACQKSEEEFRSGFPLLSRVFGRNSFKLIEFAGTLTDAKCTQLCRALLKRFHPQALLLKSLKIEPAEQSLIDQYLNYDTLVRPDGTVAMKGAASIREGEILASLDRPDMKPDRAAVRKLVVSRLKGQLGSPQSGRAGIIEYLTAVPGWKLRTHIDFGGSYNQINYHHAIIPNGSPPVVLPIHICGWMGVAGQTTWDTYTSQHTEEVADAITMLIKWFLGQWEQLIPADTKT